MEEKAVKVKESAGYIVFKIVNTIFMILICVMTLYPFLYLVAQYPITLSSSSVFNTKPFIASSNFVVASFIF